MDGRSSASVDTPMRRMSRSISSNLAQRLFDLLLLVRGQQPDFGQHLRVGDGRYDVVPVESLIKADALGKLIHPLISLVLKDTRSGGGGQSCLLFFHSPFCEPNRTKSLKLNGLRRTVNDPLGSMCAESRHSRISRPGCFLRVPAVSFAQTKLAIGDAEVRRSVACKGLSEALRRSTADWRGGLLVSQRSRC